MKRVNKKILFFFAFIFCLNTNKSFSYENDLFKETLIRIISDYFETEFKENEISFENIIDTEEIWFANFFYCQSEYSIIINNINLQVILKNAVNTIIIYESHRGSSLGFLVSKEWIYSYILYLNSPKRSTGDPHYRLRGLLDYLESRSLDTREFHIPESSSEPDIIIPLSPPVEGKFKERRQKQ